MQFWSHCDARAIALGSFQRIKGPKSISILFAILFCAEKRFQRHLPTRIYGFSYTERQM